MDNKGFGMNFVKIIKDRLIKNNGLLVVLSITATLFILGPTSVFFDNYYGLMFSFSDLMLEMAFPFIITTVILLLLVVIVPNKLSNTLLSLLLMVGVAFWLQGLFLTFGYGILDGSTDLSKLKLQGFISTITWIICILIGVLLSKKLIKLVKPVIFIIIISQLSLIIPSIINAIDVKNNMATKEDSDENKEVYLTVEDMKNHRDMFNFSKDKNIIYIILDTFDYEIFEKLLNEDKIKKAFKDFTIYSNYSSVVPNTPPSVMPQFTGKVYDNSKPYSQMKKESFTSGYSVPEVLKDNGWSNKVYTKNAYNYYYHTPKLYDSAYKVPNTNSSDFNLSEVNEIVYASYFKYMPHFLKGNYLVNKSLVEWDFWFLDFVRNKQFKNQSEKPVFFTVQLYAFHSPYIVDKDLNVVESSNVNEQGYASLMIVNEFLDKLKEIGVYDNSLIIITGDHGGLNFRAHTTLMIKDINKERGTYINYPTFQVDMKDYLINFLKNSETNVFPKREERFVHTYTDVHNSFIRDDYFGVMYKVLVPTDISDATKYIKTGEFYYPYNLKNIIDKNMVIDNTNYEKNKSFFNGEWNIKKDIIYGVGKSSKLNLLFNYNIEDKNNYIKTTLNLDPNYHSCDNQVQRKDNFPLVTVQDYKCDKNQIDIYTHQMTILNIDFLSDIYIKSINIEFLNNGVDNIFKDVHYYGCGNNCTKNVEGIVLQKNGVQYGPYITLDKGEYKITITGDNLDKGKFDTYMHERKYYFELYDINVQKNKIEYKFKVEEKIAGVEHRLHNPQDLPITITNITREKIN